MKHDICINEIKVTKQVEVGQDDLLGKNYLEVRVLCKDIWSGCLFECFIHSYTMSIPFLWDHCWKWLFLQLLHISLFQKLMSPRTSKENMIWEIIHQISTCSLSFLLKWPYMAAMRDQWDLVLEFDAAECRYIGQYMIYICGWVTALLNASLEKIFR